jgi:phage tail-like protein
MAEFTVNPKRFDPYKNFQFRIKWDGRYVAGVSRISGLRRTTEVIQHREGGDPSSSRKSPGVTEFAPITLERGVTHDPEFESSTMRPDNSSLPIRSIAVGSQNMKYCRISTPTRTQLLSSVLSWKTKAGNETNQ